MDHADHLNLLRDGVTATGGIWADFGAGRGAFTLALAQLLGRNGEIHAIDRDAGALRANEHALRTLFPPGEPAAAVRYVVADFARHLALPPLDGIVVANALHFQRDLDPIVSLFRTYLRPGGRMLVVEYNISQRSSAVPYPLPYSRWDSMASRAGFQSTELLASRPSRSLREIYSAVSW